MKIVALAVGVMLVPLGSIEIFEDTSRARLTRTACGISRHGNPLC